jgi:DNA polymerase III delta prime subunit
MNFKIVALRRHVTSESRVETGGYPLDYSKNLEANLNELAPYFEQGTLDSLTLRPPTPTDSKQSRLKMLQLRHIIMLELIKSIIEKKDAIGDLAVSRLFIQVKNTCIVVNSRSLESVTPGSYALLTHSKTAPPKLILSNFNGRHTFTLPEKTAIAENDKVELLGGILPFLRAYDACGKPVSPELNLVLEGNIRDFWIPKPTQSSKDFITSVCDDMTDPKLLTDNQLTAVSRFLDAKKGLQLLVGPPGTGKTTTIIALIAALVKQGHKVLASAPSNQAVQNIARLLHKQFPDMPIVLLSAKEKTPEDLHALISETIKKGKVEGDPVVFLATLSGTGSKAVSKIVKKATVLIVDEAGQSPQHETIIPIALYNPTKILLIGDPNQLPPVILSDHSKKLGADHSLMSLLIEEHNQPYSLLNAQFRMHPEISQFPRQLVYGGELEDSAYVHSRVPYLDDSPYGVVNVPHSEEMLYDGKYANLREAKTVMKLAKYFHQKGVTNMAAITPYKGQLDLLKDLLAKTSARPPLHISTVDSFQGGEVDVLFLSLVRSNSDHNIGFLKDFRRLNVALTRAKHCFRLVCDVDFFDPFKPRGHTQFKLSSALKVFREIPKPNDEDVSDSFSELGNSNVLKYSAIGYKEPGIGYQNRVQENKTIKDFLEKNNLTDLGYDDDVDELLARFEPAHNSADLFNAFDKMLNAADADKPLFLGEMEIFHHPSLPRGTHIIQDVLSRVKNWSYCSLEGIPEDTFDSMYWKTFYKNIEVEECEDYGYPFDEYDTYQSCGYSSFSQSFPVEETELESKDLLFKDTSFKKSNLKNVNFHNSRFVNVDFDGANTIGTRVNLKNMDEYSRHSFLKSQGQDRPLIGYSSKHNIVQMLIADAKSREVVSRKID